METIQLDIPHLSSYFSIPENSFNSLLSTPTFELVQTLLVRASTRAHEHEEVQAERAKLEVQLESVVRTGDAKIRALKVSAEKCQKEVEELRQRLQAEGETLLCLERIVV